MGTANNNWVDVWDCMEENCRGEVVQIPFSLIRTNLDLYLKKHRFCCECKNMVNKAFTLLVEEGEEPAKVAGEKSATANLSVNDDGTANLFSGISTCAKEGHVHVEADERFLSQLFALAIPELDELPQERHAKTIEKAQKEVLTCIGITLFERFQRVQQKLKESEQACNLLFLVCLKTLRKSLDLAAEKKRGVGDLELLCEEMDREEKKREDKRERKRKAKARKRENKTAASPPKIEVELGSDGESNSGESRESSRQCSESSPPCGENSEECEELDCCDKEVDCDKENQHEGKISLTTRPRFDEEVLCSKSKKMSPIKRTQLEQVATLQHNMNLLHHRDPPPSLADMLEEGEDDTEEISQEDIKSFLDRREDLEARRKQLRENLKQKFAALCVNSSQWSYNGTRGVGRVA